MLIRDDFLFVLLQLLFHRRQHRRQKEASDDSEYVGVIYLRVEEGAVSRDIMLLWNISEQEVVERIFGKSCGGNDNGETELAT